MASRTSIKLKDTKDKDIKDIENVVFIHQLPVEILLIIFDELSLQDIFRVQLVCKRWRDVIIASFYLWDKHVKAIKQNEGYAVKRKFNQLLPASTKDPLLARKAVQEVNQKLKNLRANFQKGKSREVEITLSEHVHNADNIDVDFQKGIVAIHGIHRFGKFKFYHLYDLALAGSLSIFVKPRHSSRILIKIQGDSVLILGEQESPGLIGEIWNWRLGRRSCGLTKFDHQDVFDTSAECIFKDNFVAVARYFLVVWKCETASGGFQEDGKEKVLMPMFQLYLGRDYLSQITSTRYLSQITYGDNKIFFYTRTKKVQFLCLQTGTINNVVLSEEISLVPRGIFLNYPLIVNLHGTVLGLLTESPVKPYYFARISTASNRSGGNGGLFPIQSQESRRWFGVVHNLKPGLRYGPKNLHLVSQRCEDDIRTADSYASVDLRRRDECLKSMDDYFLVLFSSTTLNNKLVVMDYFDV